MEQTLQIAKSFAIFFTELALIFNNVHIVVVVRYYKVMFQ